MFPEELPRRLIKMFSFVGDTVLDPFLGSGTTILAAKNLDRNSIGYEVNEDFLSIIKEKVGFSKKNMFETTVFKFIKQERLELDFNKEIKRLKYVFKDPINLNKQIDPRKLQFGSRISLL
jgi:site-specific DNA-methyltransferase (adenine-specific)